MSDITIKFDPTVEIEAVQMALNTATPEQEPESYDMGQYQQTIVEGIAAPLIRLNNLAINSDQIKRFELRSHPIPAVDVEIIDILDLSRVLDAPGSDNLMIVQIIPPFDDVYKKINLRMYVTEHRIIGQTLRIHAEYNVPKQYDILLESFGQLSTYEFTENVAHRLGLGLASNLDNTTDSRYIYSPSKDLLTVLDREVRFGGSQTQLLDWWIDYWNYLNLVDIYDRFTGHDDNIKIWTQTTSGVELTEENHTDPVQVDAVISNHPSLHGSPLFVNDYKVNSNTTQNLLEGTDKTIETYSMQDLVSDVTDVMDGDVHNDIFKKYEYRGEVFGTHNYLVQEMLQRSFLQKMQSQTITVELPKPQLGLMRGGRVNLNWYECDDLVTKAISEGNQEISTNSDEIDTDDQNSPTEDLTGNAADQSWVLNKTVSGQYYILDSAFRYQKTNGGQMQWKHILTLTRPQDGIWTYMEVLDPAEEK